MAEDGSCEFFETETRLCAIHRTGGHAALPITCQMFPRVVLRDPRGAFVSLSHYCPTAAGLLFEDADPVSIVEAPPSLVRDIALDGLDATGTWPPLLRKGMLMDVDSYATWERCAIGVLTSAGTNPSAALDRIERATEALLAWTPDAESTPLSQHIEDAFRDAAPGADAKPPDGTLSKTVRAAVPPSLEAPSESDDWIDRLPDAIAALERHRAALGRWLAARLFATWMAYQGAGLRTIVKYLRAALDVLAVELARGAAGGLDSRGALEAVRRSDYLLIHMAGSERLATLLS